MQICPFLPPVINYRARLFINYFVNETSRPVIMIKTSSVEGQRGLFSPSLPKSLQSCGKVAVSGIDGNLYIRFARGGYFEGENRSCMCRACCHYYFSSGKLCQYFSFPPSPHLANSDVPGDQPLAEDLSDSHVVLAKPKQIARNKDTNANRRGIGRPSGFMKPFVSPGIRFFFLLAYSFLLRV